MFEGWNIMEKNVLILHGSPRKNGNTALLSEAFERGALEAGHKVRRIFIRSKKIQGCLGCGACQRNGGNCVQKDDMTEIYKAMLEADVIVFASPVYFYTWTAQMKTVIDRTFAVEQRLTDKTFYLIGAGAASSEDYMETMKTTFEQYVNCFRAGGNSVGGSVFGLSANQPGDMAGSTAERKAYELGKMI